MHKVNASPGVALLLPTCDLVRMSEVGGNRVERTYYHSHGVPWGYAKSGGTGTEKELPGLVPAAASLRAQLGLCSNDHYPALQ